MESRKTRFESKTQLTNPQQHHGGFNFLGVILLIIFLIAMIFRMTLFNEKFVAHELSNSTITSKIVTNVNQNLTQYGLPDNVMTKKQADTLIKTSVKQVYAGDEIDLNLNPTFNRAEKLVNENLEGLGVSTSLLPTSVTSTVKAKINSVVTQQINTEQIQSVTSELLAAKRIDTIMLIVSGILLAVMIIRALIGHHLISSLSWILIISALLTLVFVKGLTLFIPNLLANSSYLSLSTLSDQAVHDFGHFGYELALIILIVGAVLLGTRKAFKR
ncbi:hypothetical protein [Paucilactobacillus hokkaidonensis]|nr:hypothetical protein [Paucilactobacillus hokkaidonensis]